VLGVARSSDLVRRYIIIVRKKNRKKPTYGLESCLWEIVGTTKDKRRVASELVGVLNHYSLKEKKTEAAPSDGYYSKKHYWSAAAQLLAVCNSDSSVSSAAVQN